MNKKAGRKKRDWLGNLQEGKMKDMARLFFLPNMTKAEATKILYSDRRERKMKYYRTKRGYTAPEITKRIREWQELGFIITSKDKILYWKKEKEQNNDREIEIKCGKPAYAYLMNLEPLYRFCKEYHAIEFNQEEKEFLSWLFLSTPVRRSILQEYPKEDIINAILKFYIKHYTLPYSYTFRLKEKPLDENMAMEFEKAKIKAEEANKNQKYFFKDKSLVEFENEMKSSPFFENKNISKRRINWLYNLSRDIYSRERNREYTFMDAIVYHPERSLDDGFHVYHNKCREYPNLVTSVDGKFMKALGILPD